MLITFKSTAAPALIMQTDLARFLLGLIDKKLGERGVISHTEMDVAIAKLEAAMAQDKQHIEAMKAEHTDPEERDEEELLGLSQRAYPLLDMLREARKENADVMWGV
ncbi:hypothetical protein PATSB16_35740 [Pandoraea thiooxydans]|uniref:DUF1840 domain-containing protein n=1 Tax=Pandoraea thiooxydans TaxID=445709 RepID=A0A0G3ETE6_9BURK|nr:DUF1840 domain-containing protein [Pandoraea thiooxydans]AKJ69299.1 hypothetical protein ABW99_14815 [Pandoraea thiooxydans]APR96910.1 hypothetical protein PATSB16_35740 [Pandoraea thiooxydans]